MGRVAVFAGVLFAVQMLEKSALYFCFGCFAYIMLAALAFNAAGGLARAGGAYILFNVTLVALIGLVYKAWLREPAEANMRDPMTTIEVYVVSAIGLFVAAFLSRLVSRKAGLLQNVLKEKDTYRGTVGSIVFYFIGPPLIFLLLGRAAAPIESALNQLAQLLPVAIIVGVMHEIRRTGGTRSISLPVMFTMGYYFVALGLLGYSKQGMLLPIFCWLLPVCALRFRMSRMQVAAVVLGIAYLFHYLVPYAQYGRRNLGGNFSLGQQISLAADMLLHPERTLKTTAENTIVEGYELQIRFYNRPEGFFDRLQMIAPDDALISLTNESGVYFGLTPITFGLAVLVPRVFWPDKPYFVGFGNTYANELGLLSEGDTSTGVSFSAASEAYHMAGWVGIGVLAPIIWFILFVIFDALCGDLRSTPWGLLTLSIFGHAAPEGGLSGLIYTAVYGAATITFCAYFTAWIAPPFATVLIGGSKGPAPVANQQHILPSTA